MGNFGGGHFFDYTAYGDTIITAARLEAANKQLGTRICVSAAIAEGARAFRGRPVGGLMLRGRGNPLRAFNPLSNDDAEQSWLKSMTRHSHSLRREIPLRCQPLHRTWGRIRKRLDKLPCQTIAERSQGRMHSAGLGRP